MAEVTTTRRLAALSRKWQKPLQKLPQTLIRDTHQEIRAQKDLKRAILGLHKSHCFSRVLWKFFHADVSQTHLELLLLVLIFELKTGQNGCWSLAFEDDVRFSALIERVLAESIRPGYEALNGVILVFLGHLFCKNLEEGAIFDAFSGLIGKPILANLPQFEAESGYKIAKESPGERSSRLLKQKWLYTVTSNFSSLSPKKGEEKRYREYLKCLFYLLTILVGQDSTRENVVLLLKEMNFVTKAGETPEMKTLLFYLNGDQKRAILEDKNAFFGLQKAVFGLFQDQEWLAPFFLLPSRYDTTTSEVNEILQKFTLEQLQKIAKILNLSENLDHLNTVKLLSDYAFSRSSQYSLHALIASIGSLSEIDTVDRYLTSSESAFYVPESVPLEGQYESTLDYLHRAISSTISDFSLSSGEEIHSVLGRLTVVDPENDTKNAIKGQSKYFTRVESLSDGELLLRAKDWEYDAIEKGDYIALLHLQKPVKYSPHKRVVEHGLSMVRMAKVKLVEPKNRKIKVDLAPNEANLRLNYAIRFSKKTSDKVRILHALEQKIDPVETHGKLILPSFSCSFLGKKTATSVAIPRMLKIVSKLDVQALKEDYNLDLGTKRRKDSNGTPNTSLASENTLLFSENSLKITKTHSEKSNFVPFALNGAQTRALISSLGNGLTLIDAPPHSGTKTLLNGIILSLNATFPTEKTLLILPNSSYVLRFEAIDMRLKHKVVKVSAIEDSIKTVDFFVRQLLEEVEKVAKSLNLGDFGFHESFDNAQLFYDVQVEPRWKQFLEKLSKDENSYVEYPFKKYSKLELSSADFKKIATSYSQIRGIFAELQKLAPLDKFSENTDQLGDYLVRKYSNFVCVSHESLLEKEVTRQKYDSVIVLENENGTLPSMLSVLNNEKLKRLVLFGGSEIYARFHGKIPEITLTETYGVRKELLALVGQKPGVLGPKMQYNPGLKEIVQLVKVPGSSTKVNLEEAEFCVALYQYFRLLGYPRAVVSILVSSPYQMVLLKEILAKTGVSENENASDEIEDFQFGWPILEDVTESNCNDFVIVSLHNSENGLMEDIGAEKARLGLYYVGEDVGAKISKGPLEIYTGASYRKGTDHRSSGDVYEFSLARLFREYVAQMAKTRMG